MKTKILVTGGQGIIARHIKEKLGNKYDVLNPGRSELDLLNSSEIESYLRSNKPNTIIHTANYDAVAKTSTKDKSLVLENNLRMFYNLSEFQHLYGTFINLGSGAEFDRLHWKPKMNENYIGTHIPSDQYGFSKYVVSKYIELFGHPFYNLRLFAIFGKYEHWQDRFISNAICRVINNMPVIINQNVNFDYMYVDDLMKILDWFLEYNDPVYNIYNVCTGNVYDLKTITEKIFAVSNKNTGIFIKNLEIGNEYSGDNRRLIAEMGKFEFENIDESIEKLYYWYLRNQHIIYEHYINKR